MAAFFQKNKQQDLSLANVKLAAGPVLDSKDDLFSKANINKQASLSDLKFPGSSNEAKYAQAESVEKSLNDVSGTAIKIGLKGLVALSKAQQQLEDRSTQRAIQIQINARKPIKPSDRLANLLAVFSMIKSSAIVKKLSKLFSKRINQDTEAPAALEETIVLPEQERDHLEDKPQR